MSDYDYCLIKKSLTGPDNECGDSGIFKNIETGCFLAHIDALGHGKKAFDVAELAVNYLEENFNLDLMELMNGLHAHLKGSRGVVAAFCRLDYVNKRIEHIGIGNISVRIYGQKHLSIISRDGVIGYSSISPKIQRVEMYRGDILVLTSDGIKEHFRMEEYPGLLYGSSQKIAKSFVSNLGKENDDVSCSVLRCKL